MSDFKKKCIETQKGDKKSLRKGLSLLDGLSSADKKELWTQFLQKKNRPPVLGLVGTPGAGKSTFLNQLLNYKKSKTPKSNIGMLLIDPSNPVTGGSILGDRIRLIDHYLDETVFIRSISNNGDPEGVHPNIDRYLMYLSLFPFSLILVEVVGGGQSSTSISQYSDKTILIFDPGSGDGVQHLKSGIASIADDIIVTKADLYNTSDVKQSLSEWSDFKGEVWSTNLLEVNSLDSFFDSRVFQFKVKNSEKLILEMLKKNCIQDLKNQLNDFCTDYFKLNAIDDKSVQAFNQKFRESLSKNH